MLARVLFFHGSTGAAVRISIIRRAQSADPEGAALTPGSRSRERHQVTPEVNGGQDGRAGQVKGSVDEGGRPRQYSNDREEDG